MPSEFQSDTLKLTHLNTAKVMNDMPSEFQSDTFKLTRGNTAKVKNDREKSQSQSLTFWHVWEKHGFYFLEEVSNLIGLIVASNEIDRVSNFDNSLSFGAKQNALGQIFFELWIFKDFFMKNSNWIFFDFLWFCVGSIKECIYVCLGMQIQENMFMNITAHLWGCLWAF